MFFTRCWVQVFCFSCHFSFNLLQRFCLSCVGTDTLFDKALVEALACGALAMCAMWVGRISKFLCGGVKKLKHFWVGIECRGICLSVSFFIPSLIFIFIVNLMCRLSFLRLCITDEAICSKGLRATFLSTDTKFYAGQNA